MADNITAPATGAVLATDDVGGVHYPRTKVSFGVDGAVVDVSASAPLPVTGTFYPATQPVSAAALPLPAGAATSVKQDTQTTAIQATASADDIFTITPSDSTDLATVPKALLVTVAGNLAVRGTGNTTVTIPVSVGQILPLRARRVMAASTATVVGLA